MLQPLFGMVFKNVPAIGYCSIGALLELSTVSYLLQLSQAVFIVLREQSHADTSQFPALAVLGLLNPDKIFMFGKFPESALNKKNLNPIHRGTKTKVNALNAT